MKFECFSMHWSVFLFIIVSGFAAYQGIVKRNSDALTFCVMLCALLGALVGFFFNAPSFCGITGQFIGLICGLLLRKLTLTESWARIMGVFYLIMALVCIVLYR